MATTLRAILPAALLVLCAPACLSAQGSRRVADRAALLLSNRPMSREGCEVQGRPNPLPSVGALLDSAALDARVREYVQAQYVGGSDSLHVVLSIGFGEHGDVARARPIDWYLPEGAGDAIAAMVHSTLRRQRGEMNLRLRIDLPARPAYRVGRAEVCRPRGLERVDIEAPALAEVEAPRPVRVRVTVGAHGEMLGSVIVSSSGQRYWDDVVTRFIDEARFTPGLIDGEAQVMEYEQTVRFRSR
ncbi:MAG: hypothetical protein JWM27_1124 [Gemmatimonadetes bacterium]|nr:hypothetical protein [Gemmatimonadota bacterium]